MKSFIRTTLIGGVLFLIPLAFAAAVFSRAFQVLKLLAVPLGKLIGIETVIGIAFVEVLTAALMLLCCFIAGLVARSSVGRKAYATLDELLLEMIPGYSWVKGVTGDISDDEAERILKPVLVQFDDQHQIAFEVDRTSADLVAVYLPGAPDPRSGALSYVTADRVRPLDTSFQAVAKVCKSLGRGSSGLMAG